MVEMTTLFRVKSESGYMAYLGKQMACSVLLLFSVSIFSNQEGEKESDSTACMMKTFCVLFQIACKIVSISKQRLIAFKKE